MNGNETGMSEPAPSTPKVVHLISSLGVGGAERLLVDLVGSLDSTERANVTVLVMNEADASLLAELSDSGVRLIAWKRPRGSRDPRYLLRLLQLLDASGTNILHAHNHGSKAWAMLVKLLRPRTRVVFTVHAMGVAAGYGAARRRLHNRLVDRTIAISEAVAVECRRSGLRAVVPIKNGVNVARFAGSEGSRTWEPGARPLVLTVARLVKLKGQDILIEAAAKLKQRGISARYRLVGSRSTDEPDTARFFKELIARLGLEHDVEIVEGCADAAPHVRQADLCVVPSRQEGFGLAIVEAMAAGVPVIASHLDGPSELVDPGRSGLLFEPGNADDLAEKIAMMLTDRERAASMADAGHAVAQAHSIEVMRDAYRALYRDVAR